MSSIKKQNIYDYACAEDDAINTVRAITLFGKNVSTYKFGLLHTLMKLPPISELSYSEFRSPFVEELFRHYNLNSAQYTSGNNSLTKAFDRYIATDQNSAEWTVVLQAAEPLVYNNVFDAFHNLGGGTIKNQYRLFEHDRKGKKLILTDHLNSILEDKMLKKLVAEEGQGRWRVVEEAWKAKLSPNLLEYNEDDGQLYTCNNSVRAHLRSTVSVLLPYQHGRCFYCNRRVNPQAHKDSNDFPDVDHFMPLSFLIGYNIQPVNPNGIWNLVIACKECNRGTDGKFASPPHERYFKLLHDRNLLFTEEHRHSLKNSILISLMASNSTEVTLRMRSLYNKFKYITGWQPKIIYPSNEYI